MGMELDYKALGFWLQFVQVVATGFVFLYVWITNRQKANTQAIKEMRDEIGRELNELDDRLICVEKDIEHLPTHDDMAKLHSRINETSEAIKHIAGQLNQIDRTTQMINQYLLDKGK